ncbi:hypothetical protein [Tardiphaga sp. 862_B3_N1_1]|uniref:hypothetical protein n=1 Tax=Tardiphaga sp. 862_B3_N1_1 TaxID=3240763 RepID=UPI003F8A769C
MSVPGYEKLAQAYQAAYEQASVGKGKERHASDNVPFHEQPMTTINRQLGSIDGFVYQAHKKSLEAKRLPLERAQAELLGAMNYLAGAWIELERQRMIASTAVTEKKYPPAVCGGLCGGRCAECKDGS